MQNEGQDVQVLEPGAGSERAATQNRGLPNEMSTFTNNSSDER